MPDLQAATRHLTLITGHSRGLGAALAEHCLTQPDSQVLGISRHPHPTLAHPGLLQWSADLSDPVPVAQRLHAWLAAQDGAALQNLTLIHNAGQLPAPGALAQQSAAAISQAIRVGLEAALLLGAAFIAATERWAPQAQRRLLFVSSGLGRRAMAGSVAYCAAKAGLDHACRALALEQAAQPHPVRIESMAPGVIDTDMQAQLRQADPSRFADQPRFAQLHAERQLQSPAEAAQRLLARLARADFGHQPVSDVREA